MEDYNEKINYGTKKIQVFVIDLMLSKVNMDLIYLIEKSKRIFYLPNQKKLAR